MSTVKDVGTVLSAIDQVTSRFTGLFPGVGGTILGVLSGVIGLAGDLMQTSEDPITHITRIRSAEAERAKVEAEVKARIHGQ